VHIISIESVINALVEPEFQAINIRVALGALRGCHLSKNIALGTPSCRCQDKIPCKDSSRAGTVIYVNRRSVLMLGIKEVRSRVGIRNAYKVKHRANVPIVCKLRIDHRLTITLYSWRDSVWSRPVVLDLISGSLQITSSSTANTT